MILNKIGQVLKSYDDFAIVSHVSPDGDSIGSMLGLYNTLIESGKKVDVFVEKNLPEKYSFLPGYKNIKTECNKQSRYSCLIILDCADILRLGELKDLINNCDISINIDHHISNSLNCNINYVDSNASSTGEIIYQILKLNGYNINYDTAMCLYTSILTDTGGFKYTNTTSITFSIVGDLINTGIKFSDIYSKIYDERTMYQIKLLGKVLPTLEVHFNNKVALLTLSNEMLKECNANENDAEDFVNYARNIDTVEVGIFIKQIDDLKCRVSLRSKNYIDVSQIASKFNGGGHIKAAGCTIEGNINEVKNKVLNAIKESLEVIK
ncbi:bifunctional oligoribonuclease/PAP phosphatase NrnA [Caloramator sp. E03]|uniref:DHH family phosphoesterase n=1 Tax=Caloramator sp. E03 TaxID=2576307 RepID=UPI001110C3D8|nr:bifunctional oligoribonuclease/PAP phosphatase NrnA [Caloramator sp. E03]QCX32282.1 bifunctional oligoribonuclease/PAP phosphatase NrnA [Caloramator sp. E03]